MKATVNMTTSIFEVMDTMDSLERNAVQGVTVPGKAVAKPKPGTHYRFRVCQCHVLP